MRSKRLHGKLMKLDLTPDELNLVFYLGDDYSFLFQWNDDNGLIDVTGMMALLQIKNLPTDIISLFAYTQLSGITLHGGIGILVSGEYWNIEWKFPNADGVLLSVGKFVYDLQMTDTLAKVKTPIKGELQIKQDVSRL